MFSLGGGGGNPSLEPLCPPDWPGGKGRRAESGAISRPVILQGGQVRDTVHFPGLPAYQPGNPALETWLPEHTKHWSGSTPTPTPSPGQGQFLASSVSRDPFRIGLSCHLKLPPGPHPCPPSSSALQGSLGEQQPHLPAPASSPLSPAAQLLQGCLPQAAANSRRWAHRHPAGLSPSRKWSQAGPGGLSLPQRRGKGPPGREDGRWTSRGTKALSWHFWVCVWRQLGAELLKTCERRGCF